MIKLEQVTKQYSGQTKPAVDNLSLNVEEGEICVFLGPSGCGKSTTLRMINRMIEPTSGSIKIDGKDIKESNPDKLRMGIGYVIQQIGLLPHKTIEENIAIVPRLYGWSKDKIKNRVTELLELIGLDPEVERGKYPSQLSGGQMQRVGVARAMAVDPPIMLMDEPFGAVDPIARKHLQDEFLRLQKQLKKTICFVTHDIDEAIKMGDKIAIFNNGKIVQYDTPRNILSNPVNDFVRDFIGSDRMVKNLNVVSVGEMAKSIDAIITEKDLPVILDKFKKKEWKIAILVDDLEKPVGYITSELIEKLDGSIDINKIRKIACSKRKAFLQSTTSLQEALCLMLENDAEYLGVLKGNKLFGVVSFRDIRRQMSRKEGE